MEKLLTSRRTMMKRDRYWGVVNMKLKNQSRFQVMAEKAARIVRKLPVELHIGGVVDEEALGAFLQIAW